MHPLPPLLAAALAVGVSTAQSTFVIPSTLDQATRGNATTGWPWNRTANNQVKIQYCYDSSHFTSNGINSVVVITDLRFRAQESTGSWTGGTYANVVITIGEAGVDHAAMNSTFASNWLGGTAPMPAYAGPVTMMPGTVTSSTTPGPWYIAVTLANPIVYDPTTGNDLLFEFQNFAAWSGGTGRDTDCGTVPTPLTTRVHNTSDAQALTGTIQANVGLVCELTFFGTGTAGSFQTYGAGCAGSAGVPTLTGQGGSVPRINSVFTFEVGSVAPGRPVWVMIGFTQLPGVDLGVIGMPGCPLWTDIVFALPSTANAAGVASAPIGIPNDPNNVGLMFKSQGFVGDPGSNPFGAVLSAAAAGTIGS